MDSIFLEDACAIASKIESEFDKLIQPSVTDKAVIILYRALLEEQAKNRDLTAYTKIKAGGIHRQLESRKKVVAKVREHAMKDAIEAVDAAGGDNEDYHIEAIKRKFGVEI